MNENEIFELIKKIIVNKLAVDPSRVTPEAKFRYDLEADSLDLVEMIMDMEDQATKMSGKIIRISESEAERIIMVQDTIDFISAKLKK